MKKYSVHQREEAHIVDDLAVNRKNNEGWIIDPTVKFESNLTQPREVDNEKKNL